MDLLMLLKKEVEDLELTDEYEIAYLIYIRTGELFDYDPLYEFDSVRYWKNAQIVIDKTNVQNDKIICFSWSYLYKDLLNSFGISAEVIEDDKHAFVRFIANGKTYEADITTGYEDISSIKFGLPIDHFCGPEFFSNNVELNKKIGYYKGVSEISFLEMLYQELEMKGQKNAFTLFHVISKLMSYERPGVGFISARWYVDFIIKTFLKSAYMYYDATNFIDYRTKDCLRIYTLTYMAERCYFVLRTDKKGYYKFYEVSDEEVMNILSLYQISCYEEFDFVKRDTKRKRLV